QEDLPEENFVDKFFPVLKDISSPGKNFVDLY
ncbi:hypothetical protein C8D70_1322, partial [Chryseobacterium sp. CBTAP 102]